MTVNETQKTKVDVEQTRVNRADNNNRLKERKSNLKELALIQDDRRSTEVSADVGMWGEVIEEMVEFFEEKKLKKWRSSSTRKKIVAKGKTWGGSLTMSEGANRVGPLSSFFHLSSH